MDIGTFPPQQLERSFDLHAEFVVNVVWKITSGLPDIAEFLHFVSFFIYLPSPFCAVK